MEDHKERCELKKFAHASLATPCRTCIIPDDFTANWVRGKIAKEHSKPTKERFIVKIKLCNFKDERHRGAATAKAFGWKSLEEITKAKGWRVAKKEPKGRNGNYFKLKF